MHERANENMKQKDSPGNFVFHTECTQKHHSFWENVYNEIGDGVFLY